jgi:hypothetical protein
MGFIWVWVLDTYLGEVSTTHMLEIVEKFDWEKVRAVFWGQLVF